MRIPLAWPLTAPSAVRSMYDGFVRVPGGHVRARKVTFTGNVTARCARQRRLFPLSARTGTSPWVSDISSVSKPAGEGVPGGPPGARTVNCALVTPGDRTIFSRISAYCTSGEPLRTGRTTMSIDAAESTTTGRFPPRCAEAGPATTRAHSNRPSDDETRISLLDDGRHAARIRGKLFTASRLGERALTAFVTTTPPVRR